MGHMKAGNNVVTNKFHKFKMAGVYKVTTNPTNSVCSVDYKRLLKGFVVWTTKDYK